MLLLNYANWFVYYECIKLHTSNGEWLGYEIVGELLDYTFQVKLLTGLILRSKLIYFYLFKKINKKRKSCRTIYLNY